LWIVDILTPTTATTATATTTTTTFHAGVLNADGTSVGPPRSRAGVSSFDWGL
jgi:hypothetical protein